MLCVHLEENVGKLQSIRLLADGGPCDGATGDLFF